MLRLNQFFIALYNAQVAQKGTLEVPFSKLIWESAQALLHCGVLESVTWKLPSSRLQRFSHEQGSFLSHSFEPYGSLHTRQAHIQCVLKYKNTGPLIQRVCLLSTPSRRISWDYPTVVLQSSRPGNFLLLTPHGVLTEAEALKAEIGGLPLCRIFLHPWKI